VDDTDLIEMNSVDGTSNVSASVVEYGRPPALKTSPRLDPELRDFKRALVVVDETQLVDSAEEHPNLYALVRDITLKFPSKIPNIYICITAAFVELEKAAVSASYEKTPDVVAIRSWTVAPRDSELARSHVDEARIAESEIHRVLIALDLPIRTAWVRKEIPSESPEIVEKDDLLDGVFDTIMAERVGTL
jgi:hypothetical protein